MSKTRVFLAERPTDAGEPCAVATIDPFAALDAFTAMGSALTLSKAARGYMMGLGVFTVFSPAGGHVHDPAQPADEVDQVSCLSPRATVAVTTRSALGFFSSTRRHRSDGDARARCTLLLPTNTSQPPHGSEALCRALCHPSITIGSFLQGALSLGGDAFQPVG